MVIYTKWNQKHVTLSIKPNCLTVSIQDREVAVYSFDLHGRLWTAMCRNISFRRGLDGKIVAKWAIGPYRNERRWLQPAEARQLEEEARQVVEAFMNDLRLGKVEMSVDVPAGGMEAIENIVRFNQQAVQRDIASYHQVYKPVGILPPDQYMAVVLQLTEGCSFNTCTFCNFYRDRPFRIKSQQEFSQHIQNVVSYLGSGLHLRRTIFLGDANALVVPIGRLLELFKVVHQHLDVEKLGGIYAFLDGFSGEKKSQQDFEALRALGLKRVYVGMESGNADLLRFLKKPGKPEDVIQAVQTMKAANVPVGVIVLLGAGGSQYDRQHVKDTIAAINQMGLDADDIIYFSELIENEGLEYTRSAYQAQLKPLSAEERVRQGDQIEQGMVFDEERGTPHISRYDIREFVY